MLRREGVGSVAERASVRVGDQVGTVEDHRPGKAGQAWVLGCQPTGRARDGAELVVESFGQSDGLVLGGTAGTSALVQDPAGGPSTAAPRSPATAG